MWEIYEHRKAVKQLEALPIEVLKRYEKWKDIISISGPDAVRQIRGFRDEALRREWRGHRSSRLNIQYCVIYRIEKELVLVRVVNVTSHDYRKKRYAEVSKSEKVGRCLCRGVGSDPSGVTGDEPE